MEYLRPHDVEVLLTAMLNASAADAARASALPRVAALLAAVHAPIMQPAVAAVDAIDLDALDTEVPQISADGLTLDALEAALKSDSDGVVLVRGVGGIVPGGGARQRRHQGPGRASETLGTVGALTTTVARHADGRTHPVPSRSLMIGPPQSRKVLSRSLNRAIALALRCRTRRWRAPPPPGREEGAVAQLSPLVSPVFGV